MKDKVHFIDCGANVGKAIQWARDKYKKKLIKIDAFEPELINYTSLLRKGYYDGVTNMKAHSQAVWIKDEIREFNVQYWGTRTGSSLLKDKEHKLFKGQVIPVDYLGIDVGYKFSRQAHKMDAMGRQIALADFDIVETVRMTVQCIDFSEWIQNNVKKENYNVLKIDIEGAEYQVIDHLLNTGAHEYIDEWYVEFTPIKKIKDAYDPELIERFKNSVSNFHDW